MRGLRAADWQRNMLRFPAARTVCAGGVLCAAAACVQGPNYVRPAVAVPSTYRFAQSVLPAQPTLATGAWWLELGDRRLDLLVQEALVNNRDLRVASARVDEFAAILAGTKSQ